MGRKRKYKPRKNSKSNPFWKKYRAYLKSKEWKAKREKLFRLMGKKCQKCGSTKRIEVHHTTYHRVFNEDLGDLMVVCKSCHKKIHGKG